MTSAEGERATGIGIDAVDVDRFDAALKRRPGLLQRLFTTAEQHDVLQGGRSIERLAARFAAKEATMKALGIGLGRVAFHDIEVATTEHGQPILKLHGKALELAKPIGRLHVSLTHTATLAMAVVAPEATWKP
ncbi:MAG: holo-ACP synthase [Actinomycetota bacterium]